LKEKLSYTGTTFREGVQRDPGISMPKGVKRCARKRSKHQARFGRDAKPLGDTKLYSL